MTAFATVHVILLLMIIFIHNESIQETLDEINTAFTWVYVGELSIKVIGLGFRPYLMKTTNM
jgi:hypothetical protein